MKFIARKGYGQDIADIVRKTILTQIDTIRPIAFRVGINSTVLSAGNNVMEDMVELISNVCAGVYLPTARAKLVKVKGIVDGAVTLKDFIDGSGISVCSDDKVFCNTLGPVEIEIIFRLCSGERTKEDNIYFLTKEGLNPVSYTVVQSLHTNVEGVGVTHTDYNTENEEVTINVFSKDTDTDEFFITSAIDIIKQELEKLSNLTP